jgi:hypothetical protein
MVTRPERQRETRWSNVLGTFQLYKPINFPVLVQISLRISFTIWNQWFLNNTVGKLYNNSNLVCFSHLTSWPLEFHYSDISIIYQEGLQKILLRMYISLPSGHESFNKNSFCDVIREAYLYNWVT